jgi:internalin A
MISAFMPLMDGDSSGMSWATGDRGVDGDSRVAVRGRSGIVPASLRNARDVRSVALTGGAISEVPGYLGNLKSLRSLDLSGNYLHSVPDSLGKLTGLTELDLSGNRLREVPEALRRLTSLTRLNLSSNPLREVPSWLSDLASLGELDLSDLGLLQVPGWLEDLPELTVLNLSFNHLSGRLDPLCRLRLTELDLAVNLLSRVPASLESLTALTWLDVSANALAEVPEWLGNLTALTSLDLSMNRLRKVPQVLGNLVSLRSLDLSSNEITRLPARMGNLVSLSALDVSDNQLEILPAELGDLLVRGLTLRMARNPLTRSLPEIVTWSADQLATYLRSLHDGAPQYEAKLIVVGDGNVGKTSLVAAVRGEPFIAERPTTHGIEVSPISLRHPVRDLDMTLRAWDFGGQEVYHVTHPFFFSPRALYLVVWHARQGHDQDEV